MSELTDDEQMQRDERPLDYSPSSGSMGVPSHSDGPTDHDGRAKTVTTFSPDTEGTDSRDWQSLYELQDGKYDDEMKMRGRHADQRRDLGVLCSQLPLTAWEIEYANHLLAECHLIERERNANGSFYNRGETLVLAVVTFAANKNERRIRQKSSFSDLRENFGVSPKEIRSERKAIRNQI